MSLPRIMQDTYGLLPTTQRRNLNDIDQMRRQVWDQGASLVFLSAMGTTIVKGR